MANLENVSTGDLCQILAEVNDADATQRLMAAIAYEEIDELTQKRLQTSMDFPVDGPQSGSTGSNGSKLSRSMRSSTTNHDPVDRPSSPIKSTSGSWMFSTNRRRKPVLTRLRGLFHWLDTTSSRSSALSTVNGTFAD